jgi:hypothetical protein
MGYPAFSDLFQGWMESLEQIQSKAKWLETADAQAADVIITRWVNEIVGLVAQAQGNGVAWLLQTSFFERIANVSNLLATTIFKRVSVAREIAKDFEREGIAELGKIIEYAPAAQELARTKAESDKAAERIKEAATKAKSSYEELDGTIERLNKLKQEVVDAHKTVTEANAEVGVLHTDVVAFRGQAEIKAGELERRIAELTSAVDGATQSTSDAIGRLNRVLVDARKQGLAGAFTERGKKIFFERAAWGAAFIAAVGLLAVVSIKFAAAIDTLTYEALGVALLRRVALAAPLVWIGWYAATQLGRLGRVQEDYEYKAATALAFQSYKSEVETMGSSDLTASLLKNAIETFGENPVRLYDHAKHDPVTPTEDLIKRLESDGSFSLLKRLAGIFRVGV